MKCKCSFISYPRKVNGHLIGCPYKDMKDPISTVRAIAKQYTALFDLDTKNISRPDRLSFFTGKFECETCGKKYRLFHFLHLEGTQEALDKIKI